MRRIPFLISIPDFYLEEHGMGHLSSTVQIGEEASGRPSAQVGGALVGVLLLPEATDQLIYKEQRWFWSPGSRSFIWWGLCRG